MENIVFENAVAKHIKIKGIVQGVGFRPFIHRLSKKHSLGGWVLNDGSGVVIHWEGSDSYISRAVEEITDALPPLAQITSIEIGETDFSGLRDFTIRESACSEIGGGFIPADMAPCNNCLAEFKEPSNSRYLYPFINCTDCGPRYTIIKKIPYDRESTTMAAFEMCLMCSMEYNNPEDRRFHAQPNACPVCGPSLSLLDSSGKKNWAEAVDIISSGGILAVKGLGGYHLVCDALNDSAVNRLRYNKIRNSKPFALMAANIEAVERHCIVSDNEREMLERPERPVVILKQRTDQGLPESINPGLDSLGIMLPYTPLHYLLFNGSLQLLIMTSANISGNPMIVENAQALKQLGNIADYFLTNNREIENSCEDSVGMVLGDKWQLTRRARGYVPLPVNSTSMIKPAFCCGGDLKSTFALASGKQIFLSQPWGDLDNYLNYLEYQQAASKMMIQLNIKPEIIVHDFHPQYHTTGYAKELAGEWGIPAVAVQHHHAHMASCMADNGLKGKVLAVICDGTGYGSDGAIWGFEFLTGDYCEFSRLGHLAYVPLLGGEASIRKTSRTAFSFIVSTLGVEGRKKTGSILPDLSEREREIMGIQLEKKINSPLSSSCGRLFDAVAALLGICFENEYEGQGPMELEAVAGKSQNFNKTYGLELIFKSDGTFELDSTCLWKEMISDLSDSQPVQDMARAFHFAVAKAIRDGVVYMAKKTGLNRVVLSGGVFQNRLLTSMTEKLIIEEEIEVYTHRQVPPNDGGLSLGQAFIGNEVVA